MHAQECFACTTILCIHKNLVHPRELCASDKICTADYIWLLIIRLWLMPLWHCCSLVARIGCMYSSTANKRYMFCSLKFRHHSVTHVRVFASIAILAQVLVHLCSEMEASGSSAGIFSIVLRGGILRLQTDLRRMQPAVDPDFFLLRQLHCRNWLTPLTLSSVLQMQATAAPKPGVQGLGSWPSIIRKDRSWS